MMHVVVFEKNRDGKIELTVEELEKALNNAYNQGYKDREKKIIMQTSTCTNTQPSMWYSMTTKDGTYSCARSENDG